MKSQITFFIQLLLLSAVLFTVDSATIIYRRTVRGRFVCKSIYQSSDLSPADRAKGDVSCIARTTTVDSSQNPYYQVLIANASFTTNGKGEFSSRLSFIDRNAPGKEVQPRLTSFQVSCDITNKVIFTAVKKVTASGLATTINAGDVVVCLTLPFLFKGTVTCAGTSPPKPIARARLSTRCNYVIRSTPPPEPSDIGVFFDSSKADGSFGRSAPFQSFGVPLDATIAGTTLTCSLTPPVGTSIVGVFSPNSAPAGPLDTFEVQNSGTLDFGRVVLQDNTRSKKFCKA